MHYYLVAVVLQFGASQIGPSYAQKCGTPIRDFQLAHQVTLIRNGQTSAPGDFPWNAALYLKNGSGHWDQSCGGTLISPQLVITAAHCVVFPAGVEISAQDVKMKLGQIARDFYTTEDHSIVSTVKAILPGPRYVGVVQHYGQDIAILELTEPVLISNYVRPVCIDLDGNMDIDLQEGKTLLISGWGTNEFDVAPAKMQWTTQTFIQYQTCLRQVDDVRFITPDKFCVENIGDTGAGKGDSGGGVTLVGNDGRHYLVGVISTKITTTRRIMAATSLLDLNLRTWLYREIIRLNQPKKKTFRLERFKMTWFEANKFCQIKGGRLANHLTERDNADILNLIAQAGPYDQGKHNMVHIGGWCDKADKNTCFWIGPWTPMNVSSFKFWHHDQPDGYWDGLEHCINYFLRYGKWRWNDTLCSDKWNFICEYYNE